MQRICGSLAESGYDVLLVGRKLNTSPPLSEKKYKQKRISCWFVRGKLFYAEFNVRLFFFLLFRQTDCICAIDLDTVLACYYGSKLKGIKRVYDAHEFFSELDEVVSRPRIYRFWKMIESRMIPRFKNAYTVCDSLAKEFKKHYHVDFSVIRNMPVLQDLPGDRSPDPVILYQGAVNKGRGLDQVVLAMKKVNAKLWVCGDGNYMKTMRSIVRSNDLVDKVTFFGMLEPGILKEKTLQAYIAINPFDKRGLNQYLSLSNKFFDYIHACIPQISMNYPEYKKINNEFRVSELIDVLNEDSVSNAINKLLNNDQLYNELKQNCVIARKKLNWQNEKEKLIKFYEDLFNE